MPPKDLKKKSTQDRIVLIEQVNIPEITEILFDSSCHGNLPNLTEIFTAPTKNIENIRFEAIQHFNLFQTRNDQTRTCLDLASMLGHHEIVKLLTEKNAAMITDPVELTNGMGYSSLHLACVWNQLESIKHLINSGSDIDKETINGEKPIDIAKRYQHTDLIDYLEWIAIRNKLTRLINEAKEFLTDSTKNMDKLKKDDKKKMEKYIKDTLKWFDENQTNPNAKELFTNRIKETEEFFAPFYANIAALIAEMELNNTNTTRPPPRTPKSGRK